MDKIIIYFTNLTHINNGMVSIESIPLNIGYLAAYTKKIFNKKVEIELFKTAEELTRAMAVKPPHILTGSNYAWNSNLSYYYLAYFKKKFPKMITIMGGPTFSYRQERRLDFLKKRPLLDLYIAGEGETAFIGFLLAYFKSKGNIVQLKKEALPGCHFLRDGNLVPGEILPRISNLDIIPSPYLGGFLDKFLEQGFTPILQSNRGCPFTCAYCCSSVAYYNKINFFSVKRVCEEIDYIAARVKSPSIHIHDDNFGMFQQDCDICKKFKEVEDRYGWPVFISASTGKNSKEKIIKCLELLGSSVLFSASVQTTSKEALKNINRKNIDLGDLLNVQQHLKKIGIISTSEFILPLPGETKASHLEGIKNILLSEVDTISPYTAMLLPASPLFEEEKFDKFQMLVKYRVIPKDYGKYEGANIVEIEKVCVATKDLSFQEYVFLRGFHFILYCYYNGQVFMELLSYLRNIGCDIFDFCYALLVNIESASLTVQGIFTKFLTDTKNELWDTEEELLVYYSQEKNFQKLLRQEEGCNVLQKYHGIFFSSYFEDFLKYAMTQAELLLKKSKKDYSKEIMAAISLYILNSRGKIFDIIDQPAVLELSFNIHDWKLSGYSLPLSEYEKATSLKFIQNEKQKKIINDYITIYGDNEVGKGRILTRINPRVLFREVSVIN